MLRLNARSFTLALLIAAPMAGAQTQPPTPGLLLHLKSDAGVTLDGDVVTAWDDQSGNGFQFVEDPTGGPELVPNSLNGLPVLRFDGSNELVGDLGQSLTTATIVSLSQYTIASSNNDYLYTIGTPPGSGSQMTLARRSGDLLYHFDGSNINAPSETCVPTLTFLPVSQVFGDGTPESHDIYQNGVLELSSQATGPYSADATEFFIGNFSSGNFQFVGDLVEILVYDRVLTPSERAAAEQYLRERVGIDYVDFDNTDVVQYEFDQQPDANWDTCAGDTQVRQATNADASILLGDFDATNKVLRGSMSADGAPDYMGFVIGYQGRGSYYLFDWKRTTAPFVDFGTAEAGMSLRIIDVPNGEDPSGQDLWSSMDGDNVTTLRNNTLPWEPDTRYTYEIRFTPGQIGIDIRDDADMLLESWSVADATFGQGQFGHYINSLQGVTFGPVAIGDIPTVDADGDGVDDAMDNCIDVPNADQRDSNGDGFGNVCDLDFNGDCVVNAGDLGFMRVNFFTNNPDADINGDGIVNAIDLGALKNGFFGTPGPSGLASCP